MFRSEFACGHEAFFEIGRRTTVEHLNRHRFVSAHDRRVGDIERHFFGYWQSEELSGAFQYTVNRLLRNAVILDVKKAGISCSAVNLPGYCAPLFQIR